MCTQVYIKNLYIPAIKKHSIPYSISNTVNSDQFWFVFSVLTLNFIYVLLTQIPSSAAKSAKNLPLPLTTYY